MSPDDFKALLLTQPLDGIVTEHIFGAKPHIATKQPSALPTLRRHLCPRLNLKEENVIIVGSAQTGFSLDPDKFPARFTARSDIDVLIVDNEIFDKFWMTMLDWHYPRRLARLPGADWTWVVNRR